MRSALFGSLALLLSGCATIGGPVRPQLPPLPGGIATECRDPGVGAGRPVLSEFARNRQALAECRRKHRDTVRFYDGVRKGLAGR